MTKNDIIDATLAGKELEWRPKLHPDQAWCRFSFSQDVNFYFEEREYRLKPKPRKPREWLVVPSRNGKRITQFVGSIEDEAIMHAVLVREVTNDCSASKNGQ